MSISGLCPPGSQSPLALLVLFLKARDPLHYKPTSCDDLELNLKQMDLTSRPESCLEVSPPGLILLHT